MFAFAEEPTEPVEGTTSDTDLHVPVMHREVSEYLRLPAQGCYVDCTLGLGGHARLVSANLGRVIGIDRDAESLKIAEKNMLGCGAKCDFIHEDFRNIDKVLGGLGIDQVDGILLDLGISSYQLDNAERGFSLKSDGPLDMRMDQESYISAYDLINSLSEREISLIIKEYGEERMYKRIARYLVEQRTIKPIESTKELRDVVWRAMPSSMRYQRIHPATRTFQAFRIAVNRELESLEIALQKCARYLKPGGRICVIAFHSLEDRIVKQTFRTQSTNGELSLVTKKPLRPTEEEVRDNPRSRSARMRVAEKIS